MASPYFPEDLVAEILARLPVKSVLQFRCVCKSWHALIRHRNFIAKHFNHPFTINNDRSIIFKRSRSKPSVSLLSNETLQVTLDVNMPFFGKDITEIKIYGSCNGVVCLYAPCHLCGHDDYHYLGDDIVLWNPAIRKFKVVPLFFNNHQSPRWSGFKVYCDCIGFGVDPKTNEYKVVRIMRFCSEELFYDLKNTKFTKQVEVYTLSNNSWRIVDTIVPAYLYIQEKDVFQAYFNGFYYWCTKGAYDDKDGDVIISFDMSNEVFQKILPPPLTDANKRSFVKIAIGEFNGDIGLFRIKWNEYLDIYLRDGATKTWIKQLTISLNDEIEQVLGLCKNDKILVERDTPRTENPSTFLEMNQVALYDLNTQELKNLRLYGESGYFRVVFYRESLVLL